MIRKTLDNKNIGQINNIKKILQQILALNDRKAIL